MIELNLQIHRIIKLRPFISISNNNFYVYFLKKNIMNILIKILSKKKVILSIFIKYKGKKNIKIL